MNASGTGQKCLNMNFPIFTDVFDECIEKLARDMKARFSPCLVISVMSALMIWLEVTK